jgi:2-polyprenyl-6-methoxyphenol hydroxylase-like FAD-dependent oxidoreductase
MTTNDTDILIVGAGPVGMLLAVLLHDQGVRVTIVERQQGLYPLPRAVAFDHESRRLFGIAGLTDEIAEILEERNLKGGEEGQNFVWRDADLKSE